MDLETISKLLPESEWFVYTEPGQPLQVDKMLEKIGEGNTCLISGESPANVELLSGGKTSSFELVDYPVDYNTGNSLLTNIVTVNKDLIEMPVDNFGYIETIGGIEIQMVTDEKIKEHNEEYLSNDWASLFESISGKDIIGVWDFLTRNHIKGINKISNDKAYLTVVEALGYAQRKFAYMNMNTNKLNTNNSGPQLGLV